MQNLTSQLLHIVTFLLISVPVFAENGNPHHEHQMEPNSSEIKAPEFSFSEKDCTEMEVWDLETGMCVPVPMSGMHMTHAMLHGNAFLAGLTQQGPRGKDAIASPNMLMADLGRSISDKHFLNLNLMLTGEKWTFPEKGYPELLQIGERDADDLPYLDAQHPHSSPIMGLTLSDTIRFTGEGKDHLKIFFAPRGQATDGPVAFMHRPTGMANPDAPLGHHIGQDVSHITSTVIGASLKLNRFRIESSVFNGTEPEPTEVDLPIGKLNSGAFRLGYEFSPELFAMASIAYVKDPEPHEPDVGHQMRHSVSIFAKQPLFTGWTLHHALIHGAVTNYDRASLLNSFNYEFLLKGERPRICGRFEVLERTPGQLQIVSTDLNRGRWVSAMTLGYSHLLATPGKVEFTAGASATKNFLPQDFIGAYGGNSWSGKVFIQLAGMDMWNW